MNIHEYQAKKLLIEHNLPTPKGIILKTIKNLDNKITELNGPPWIVKSQIHAGGRGAGYFLNNEGDTGGVRLANNLEELKKEIKFMLGNILVTKQTGKKGKQVNSVYIEEVTSFKKEFYLSILIDRQVSKLMLMMSSSGGINIEEVAVKEPDKILSYHFNNFNNLINDDLIFFSNKFFSKEIIKNQFISIVDKLVKFFIKFDLSSIEINPLVLDNKESLVLLDAKISFDDNALYRHPEIAKLKDETEEDPIELEASKYQMNYVKLDGSIGCMVNGAGLAMATMDIIKYHGSEPANFLDLGGTANKERATKGFKIIQSDPNVKSILINIFGGIIRCDMIADGIISAAKELNLKLPVIVRFQGTNSKQGRQIINNSKLNIIAADTLSEAAKKAVEASKY